MHCSRTLFRHWTGHVSAWTWFSRQSNTSRKWTLTIASWPTVTMLWIVMLINLGAWNRQCGTQPVPFHQSPSPFVYSPKGRNDCEKYERPMQCLWHLIISVHERVICCKRPPMSVHRQIRKYSCKYNLTNIVVRVLFVFVCFTVVGKHQQDKQQKLSIEGGTRHASHWKKVYALQSLMMGGEYIQWLRCTCVAMLSTCILTSCSQRPKWTDESRWKLISVDSLTDTRHREAQ